MIHPSLKWISLLLCLAPAWLRGAGQLRVFDATELREPTDLAAGWLVQAGDDPAYTQPDFDDSQWKPFNAETDSLHDLFPRGRPAFIWYRLHIKVAPNDTGLALLENNISGVSELYCNGKLLLRVGQVSPLVSLVSSANMIARIPRAQVASGTIVLALRLPVAAMGFVDLRPGLYSSNLILGEESTLHDRMWLGVIGGTYKSGGALAWLDDLVSICMLLGGLLLFSTQRDHPEYLWLSLWALTCLLYLPLGLYSLFHNYPGIWLKSESIVEGFFGSYTLARMYCAFVGHRVGWKLHVYLVLTSVAVCFSKVGLPFGSLGQYEGSILLAPFILLTSVVLPVIVMRNVRRTNFSEAVLILPLLLVGLYSLANQIPLALTSVPSLRDRSWAIFFMTEGRQAGPFYIPFDRLADVLSKLSLALIILVRTNRMSRLQTLLEAEIANAREIQQVILPEELEPVLGFRVESVYLPAREVGGDFFQIVPTKDQGLLAVVGDVAGKGMPAAMLVSVLVGAVRTIIDYDLSPNTVLTKLNERMLGRSKGGFATALAAHITAGGCAHIANAGHLSPYLNGRELDLPPALPLGIVGGAQYDVCKIQLEPGDRLTFYSDGVIEAQDKNRELFGFDRAREIATQPAAAIAEAAKGFGQEDDITVVSIQWTAAAERCPVEILSSVPAPASI